MDTTLPKQVTEALAERPMRMHHALWHFSRNGWARFPAAVRTELRDRGWEPPRPAMTAEGQPELDNGSGEDFLFMHRQMIADVNEILAEVGDPEYPRVEGWPAIPGPGDPEAPVPPTFTIPGDPDLTEAINAAKRDQTFARLRDLEVRFTNPAVLRGMTLGQLGASIEFTVHNQMHLRWAAQLPAYRRAGVPFDVDPRWDEPSYDWLADPYSSHVNPIFWKLHGWVDARIDDWMRANGFADPVPWTYDPPWSGPTPPGPEHHHMTRLALRARAGAAAAEVLRSQVHELEATIEAVRASGVPEPTPFVTVDWVPGDPT